MITFVLFLQSERVDLPILNVLIAGAHFNVSKQTKKALMNDKIVLLINRKGTGYKQGTGSKECTM